MSGPRASGSGFGPYVEEELPSSVIPFGRVIEPEVLDRIYAERHEAESLQEIDADKAFADAVYAWMRDRLPFAICWFCAGMLAVILPVLVIERVLS